ncbi:hypothetical protein [Methylomonas methanica]|uniref:Uncharacterized protein n=1 Tax=Methylomonas methanica (strain DSM 25384 / MC09) TaxID=857087 RepID=G0A0R2_METMM|nr:hypothetical protein [Methylomonas methanica]AEF99996.1 hypothetical protein Metme_1577 [Methylomonas methanica MC09]
MLKTLDILLGMTVIMLIASMAVTVLTQFVSGLVNLRGKNLARGLCDLLQQIDPNLQREIAEQITCSVLTHPMISSVAQRLGDTIHREEFVKLLMDLASGEIPKNHSNPLSDEAKQQLMALLQQNGIDNPKDTVDKVRNYALQLELSNPELAANVRHSIAMLTEANSRLVAKVNGWFDQTMDRVSDRFTASSRLVSVLCSVVVVAAIQLDSLDVINRLSMDDQLRDTLISKAFAIDQAQTTAGKAPVLNVDSVKTELNTLQELGVIDVINSGQNWREHWCEVNPIGIILSVFLLSLGAPFWYGALKNLLKLRGSLAGKDDAQRQERQRQQPPKPATQP